MPKSFKSLIAPYLFRYRRKQKVHQDALPPFALDLERSVQEIKKSILHHLKCTLARDPVSAGNRDWWLAVSYMLRDRILERFLQTNGVHTASNTRRVYYLSMEYLVGRLLHNNLQNTGIYEPLLYVLKELGLDYQVLREEEMDMGLGNGGLGRLAACFLDSMATLEYPAVGYGLHYEFGLFRQEIVKGQQMEHPDHWLQIVNPWQIMRPEYTVEVPLYGRVRDNFDREGIWKPKWTDTETIKGVPWDIPIVGYGRTTVNFLRLWESRASNELDLNTFNEGGYIEAVREKVMRETISKVLYPDDTTDNGKELRLVQQYFFVACSIKDIIRRFRKNENSWDLFSEKVSIQLNDTHPTISIIELMRILVDEENFNWNYAWNICRKTFNYTNHTLLPEALETWSIYLLQKVLPRHLQIIFEINRRFLTEEVEAKWPGDGDKKRVLSLFDEGEDKSVRMAHLAVIASNKVNGVAELHTKLLKENLFPEFNELYPNKFVNVTNGITPRRWLKGCNPDLASLISSKIGHKWLTNLEALQELEPYVDDIDFQNQFKAIKYDNKVKLVHHIERMCGVEVSPNALFDVQVKRFHEYKRQHLNLLHILRLYRHLLQNPEADIHPRVFIFSGKAAPGYELAKCIIHAINAVAEVVNNDERICGKIKIAFIPNYSVSIAAKIIPAADLSEQISTAGKEASGTGNMKLALNGAMTIGTLDGANVEIKEEVGDDNIFIFGNTVEQIQEMSYSGYNSHSIYENNIEMKRIIDWLTTGTFTPKYPEALLPIRNSLLQGGDPFFVLADYEAYCQKQSEVDAAYKNQDVWVKKAILNTIRVGKFSSDRCIREYASKIWKIQPLPISCVFDPAISS